MALRQVSAPAAGLFISWALSSLTANALPSTDVAVLDAAPLDDKLRSPELVDFVDAEYPTRARDERVEGTVTLRLRIDSAGGVEDAELVEPAGHGFDEAALLAARRLRFVPARRGGVDVASRILFQYEFRLPKALPAAEPVRSTTPTPTAEQAASAPAPPRAAVEVTVRGASAGQRLRESAQAVKVVETDEARRHSADLGEVLARTEGVSVQRSGGLGSQTRLSLHGLTDDQIRFFLDGVPLEFAGFGLGISNVPLNWISRIEVYRGVVPIRLGSDALGGAIDLVTEQAARGTAATVAYTTGSFDTHQLALNARTHRPSIGFLARAAGFYDTSRNDYVVDVRVPDALGRLHPARARRFHDGYRAGGGSVELGLVNRPWARRLLLRLFGSSFDKELQHNIDMSVPYGAVSYGETALGGTLRFEQPRLRKTPFGVSLLLSYARRRLDFEDASRWVYDWFGNRVFERTAGSGEITTFAKDLSQWEGRALARIGLSYELSPLHKLNLVAAPDFTTRSGTERLRINPARIDPLTTRRNILAIVTGLEYAARDLDDRLENSLFAKHYVYRPATDQVQVFDNSIRHVEDFVQHVGFGDAFRMRFTPWLLGKASYEYATRLPRPNEVFGDGALTLPNLGLVPETSHNANLSVLLERGLGNGMGTLSLEQACFLRRTADMIVKLLAQDRVHSIHQNVFSVHTLGIDGTLRWTSSQRLLTLSANTTWQDQRNASDLGAFSPFSGQRVPNRPWLFANATADVRLPRVGAPNAELTLSWVTRYVHAFLPGWEDTTAANDSNRIPDQLTHALGVAYSVQGPWLVSCALDVSNVTNERVFDVLGVQKPGRAAFFKFTLGWDDSGGRSQSGNTGVNL
ncbi:MAG: TonB-dependent siderophore myxochelin receptor MxcH [Polyangiaceae bacterium]